MRSSWAGPQSFLHMCLATFPKKYTARGFCLGTGWVKISRSAGVLNSVQGQVCDEDPQGGPKLHPARCQQILVRGRLGQSVTRRGGLNSVQGQACAEDSQGGPNLTQRGGHEILSRCKLTQNFKHRGGFKFCPGAGLCRRFPGRSQFNTTRGA